MAADCSERIRGDIYKALKVVSPGFSLMMTVNKPGP